MREINDLEMETQKHEEAYVDTMTTLSHESEVVTAHSSKPPLLWGRGTHNGTRFAHVAPAQEVFQQFKLIQDATNRARNAATHISDRLAPQEDQRQHAGRGLCLWC